MIAAPAKNPRGKGESRSGIRRRSRGRALTSRRRTCPSLALSFFLLSLIHSPCGGPRAARPPRRVANSAAPGRYSYKTSRRRGKKIEGSMVDPRGLQTRLPPEQVFPSPAPLRNRAQSRARMNAKDRYDKASARASRSPPSRANHVGPRSVPTHPAGRPPLTTVKGS